MSAHTLTEQIDLSEARYEPEARVLRDVVLIRAGTSKNRRRYSAEVLQAAAPVFEGAKAYDSHSRTERRVSELTGWYSNVRFENNALRADRHFARTQAGQNVQAVAEDIITGRAPATLAGLSINAVGTGKSVRTEEGDVLEVESISAAVSVDDVTEPAAGGSYLLTAGGGDGLLPALIASMSYEEWFQSRPEFTDRAKREWQTVRRDEALKAAEAVAEQLRRELAEARERLQEARQQHEAAASVVDAARREALVAEALATAKLPASWKDDLRTRLLAAETDQWNTIIDNEQRKADAAGHRPRVTVTGADVQIGESAPAPTPGPRDLLPRPHENMADWARRTGRSKEG